MLEEEEEEHNEEEEVKESHQQEEKENSRQEIEWEETYDLYSCNNHQSPFTKIKSPIVNYLHI